MLARVRAEATPHVTGYWIRHCATKGIRKIRGIVEPGLQGEPHLYERRGDHSVAQGGIVGRDVFLTYPEAIRAAKELLPKQIENLAKRLKLAKKQLQKLGGVPVENEQEITIQQAVARVVRALKEDADYRYGWQANIAVQFQDSWNRLMKTDLGAGDPAIHALSNEAANNFLDLLCREVRG
jgi:hypothetical protein